jgi:hypothetical protein
MKFFYDIAAIATIIGNIILVWLTFKMLWLIRRDKEKKQSLLELQQHTTTLNNSLQEIKLQTATLYRTFKNIIKPNLMVKEIKDSRTKFRYFDFDYINSGGGCYNLRCVNNNLPIDSTIEVITVENISAGSIKRGLVIGNQNFEANTDYTIDFFYNDVESTAYKQTLHLMIVATRIQQSVMFSPPEII